MKIIELCCDAFLNFNIVHSLQILNDILSFENKPFDKKPDRIPLSTQVNSSFKGFQNFEQKETDIHQSK